MNANGSNGAVFAIDAMPRNRWYVAAFNDEVTDQPIARFILGQRIVLYRTEEGLPVALADYCPHRAMALSKGKRVHGDRLQCPYHGMEFGPDGQCKLVPSQAHAPAQMRVRAYPLVQRWQWLWIWAGAPELADESLIPDPAEFSFGPTDDDFWKVKLWHMELNCSAQLVYENLLDASHLTYLHDGQADSGAHALIMPKVTVEGNVIVVTREYEDVLTGSYARNFGITDGTAVVRSTVSRNYVGSMHATTNTFSFPQEPGRRSHSLVAPQAITPATQQSCHYFFALAANYGEEPVGEGLEQRANALWNIVLQDKEALELIQQAHNDLGPATPDISVRVDEAAIRYRRILAKLCQEEHDRQIGAHG